MRKSHLWDVFGTPAAGIFHQPRAQPLQGALVAFAAGIGAEAESLGGCCLFLPDDRDRDNERRVVSDHRLDQADEPDRGAVGINSVGQTKA
jgi:hypothetical protein